MRPPKLRREIILNGAFIARMIGMMRTLWIRFRPIILVAAALVFMALPALLALAET